MITIIRISKGKGPFYEVDCSNGESLRVSEDLLVRFRLLSKHPKLSSCLRNLSYLLDKC